MNLAQSQESRIVELSPQDVPLIVEVLSDAFRDYPVMRYVLGDAPDYDARLDRLHYLFVMGRASRNDPMIALQQGEETIGVATMSFPNNGLPEPAVMNDIRSEVWADLGDDARVRYERCTNAWNPLNLPVPHLHLNMIGVRCAHHGTGAGRKLLDQVHTIGRAAPESQGVSLTTELTRNVALYQHVGYEITGEVDVDEGLHTWALFRHN